MKRLIKAGGKRAQSKWKERYQQHKNKKDEGRDTEENTAAAAAAALEEVLRSVDRETQGDGEARVLPS